MTTSAQTTDDPGTARVGVLDPIQRVSEVLFGLIMVLTFTGSLSVAEAGRDDVRAMLIGALGCNLAWGLIDAVLYLMGCLAEKGRNLITFREVRKAPDTQYAQRLIAEALPPVVASVLKPPELELAHQIIDGLAGTFDPAELTSSYRASLRTLLEAKLAGEELPPPPEPEVQAAPSGDLLAALKASVEAAKAGPAKPAAKARKPAAKSRAKAK